jgi:hypothetical protein
LSSTPTRCWAIVPDSSARTSILTYKTKQGQGDFVGGSREKQTLSVSSTTTTSSTSAKSPTSFTHSTTVPSVAVAHVRLSIETGCDRVTALTCYRLSELWYFDGNALLAPVRRMERGHGTAGGQRTAGAEHARAREASKHLPYWRSYL